MRTTARKIKKLAKSPLRGQKGFTLIEVLVVVAILGVLAAVAVPAVSKFVVAGKDESYRTELHNVQTAVTTMMSQAASRKVDNPTASGTPTADLSNVWSWSADDPTARVYVSDYMIGLEGTTVVKTGCEYEIDADGNVSQSTP